MMALLCGGCSMHLTGWLMLLSVLACGGVVLWNACLRGLDQ